MILTAQPSIIASPVDRAAAPDAALGYRRDIDGLRALAVVPVLLFHVDLWPFSGGYVGVDIFFVISGYLIASIIGHDLAEGRFTLTGFYVRRIRRIFPALFVMIAFTILVGGLILLPLDYRRLGASALATTLFASNIYFARQSGYFGASAEEAPLLHSWSLAVEEQFYIVFPLLMLVGWRLGGRYRLLLSMVAGLSLLSAMHMVETAPASAFYLPHTRGWEFLGGAMLAVGRLPAFRSPQIANAAAATGAALIGWAVLRFSATTPFPGAHALFPVVGAMLILHAGRTGSLVSGALSKPVPVFIGRISYSLYLWHWPLIVFWKYRTDGSWEVWEQVLILMLSLLVAWASWRFVEEPFRRARSFPPARAFAFAGTLMTTGVGAGLLLYLSNGMPSRMNPSVVALDAATNSIAYLPEDCSGMASVQKDSLCVVGARKDAAPNFLLWGDSHAHALKPAFDRAGVALGLSGRIASYPACPTLLGIDRLDQPPSHDCSEFNRLVLQELATTPSVHTVILVSRWGLCANGKRPEGGKPCYLGRDEDDVRSFSADQQLFRSGLASTVATLSRMGKQVILVAPIPEFRRSVPETLARAILYNEPLRLTLTRTEYMQRQQRVFSAFDEMRARFGVTVVYPHQLLCRTGRCAMTAKGVPLYADDDHLSRQGSLLLTRMVYDALKTANGA